MARPTIIYVMGVSGSGKSTIGKLLSKRLRLPFFDADDYHSSSNISKMASGKPLNDTDRKEWLLQLNELAKKNTSMGAVIACSALKQTYRDLLGATLHSVLFIYLKGSPQLIEERLKRRKNHFMPAELLRSQFETLEVPVNALHIQIHVSPEKMIEEIISKI